RQFRRVYPADCQCRGESAGHVDELSIEQLDGLDRLDQRLTSAKGSFRAASSRQQDRALLRSDSRASVDNLGKLLEQRLGLPFHGVECPGHLVAELREQSLPDSWLRATAAVEHADPRQRMQAAVRDRLHMTVAVSSIAHEVAQRVEDAGEIRRR